MSLTDQIKGKTALVTGACSGIGLQFCHTLAAAGADVIMISNRAEHLRDAAITVSATYYATTIPITIDLTDDTQLTQLCNLIEDGSIPVPDILINNAGIFSFLPLADTPDAKIKCFIDLHIRAVTTLSVYVARKMKQRGSGYILNMSSMSCWAPMPGLAMYASTKAYIRVFSRSLNYEMRDYGVSVMAACPGGIATDLFGLPPRLKKLAVTIGAIATPEAFTRKALRRLLRRKMQYIDGIVNRIGIFAVGISPTWIRMLVKHKMLDKEITRP